MDGRNNGIILLDIYVVFSMWLSCFSSAIGRLQKS
jgi:hypothetical protein